MNAPLINGKPGESIAAADRGLQYGDGVFETISCQDGAARWLPLHLQRLRRGIQRLQLPFDEFDALIQEIRKLSAPHERCLIKIILTRGSSLRRGYAYQGSERAMRIVSHHEWPQTPQAAAGFAMQLSDVRLGINPLLAGIKHLNRLEQVLAQTRAFAAGMDEALMLSATGEVISGTMSNVFFADESGLVTPQLTGCGVEGIMRQVVLNAAQHAEIPVQVRAVSAAQLISMQEMFVTNVRLGVQSVSSFNGAHLLADQCARRLRTLIQAMHA